MLIVYNKMPWQIFITTKLRLASGWFPNIEGKAKMQFRVFYWIHIGFLYIRRFVKY